MYYFFLTVIGTSNVGNDLNDFWSTWLLLVCVKLAPLLNALSNPTMIVYSLIFIISQKRNKQSLIGNYREQEADINTKNMIKTNFRAIIFDGIAYLVMPFLVEPLQLMVYALAI